MTGISFVVTIYNKSDFIPLVTKAIFAQEGLDECEYIFVDDGSTDDSLDVLKACTQGQENVKIVTQKNAGPALATNRGIEEVTHPYIKFVDGDDILHPLATSELLNALTKLDVDLAYSLGEEVAPDSEKMQAPNLPLSGLAPQLIENPLDIVAKKALFNLTCVLVKTDAVRAMGGCDPRVFIQDYSFALRIAARTKFALVPSTLNWAPNEALNRASGLGGGAQVLHDLNAAMAYFIQDHPNLESHVKTLMLHRAAGRAWKWAHRVGGHGHMSCPFFRHMWARLSPKSGDTALRILDTCGAFREQGKVRLPA